jgi:hypothetical protein
MTRRIDDCRMVGIQLPQSIDQGNGFGRAGHASLAHRMVPHQGRNICLVEERSDRRSAGVERKFCSSSEVQHAFLRDGRWWFGVNEGPAAIKDCVPKFFRDIDRSQICRAECRHEQDELEIGHARILNIERRHTFLLSGEMVGESTPVYWRE